MRTNRDQLVIQSVMGVIADPLVNINQPYRISADGHPIVLPGTGGITYNFRVGDSAVNVIGDHIEPAVSIRSADKDVNSTANGGLQVMACVGNSACVVSGDAKGSWGRVTGKHGGINNVMVDFTREQMELMAIGDRIQVRACGQGMRLLDFPEVTLMNCAPELVYAMNLEGDSAGRFVVPVTHLIPAAVMGSGLGKIHSYGGDYDIQMFDEDSVREYKLNTLRFGDIVAIVDAAHTYGRIYRKNAISVGVVVHSRSVAAGHGPGVTTLMTSTAGKITPVIDSEANLASIFRRMPPLSERELN